MQRIYKGYVTVKKLKFQNYRGHFESLRMKEDEDIASYFLRVDEIVNTLRGIGETIPKEVIIQKVLRSLPMRFDSKVSIWKIERTLTH